MIKNHIRTWNRKFRVSYAGWLLLFTALLLFALPGKGVVSSSHNAPAGMNIPPQKVQSMAIYGEGKKFGEDLVLSQIVFNISDPTLITELLSSIEFSTERNCSTRGSGTDAYVYVKYVNGCIEVYELFSSWSHFCKAGFAGSCYFVSESGQAAFESHAQQ
jgi:hypothetical protein